MAQNILSEQSNELSLNISLERLLILQIFFYLDAISWNF